MATKTNPRAPQQVDERGAEELEQWIDNTATLYRQWQAIVKNLLRHQAKGRYDSARAVDGFMYLADAGAKDYVREFGSKGDRIDSMFNKATRRRVAEEYVKSFEEDLRNESEYRPDSAKNPSRQHSEDWPSFILEGVIESEGLDGTEASIGPDLRSALSQYESKLYSALDAIVRKHPPKDGQSIDDVWNADAPYAVFMTLNGEGIGIWDGRWDHLYDRDGIVKVQKALKSKLQDVADSTGGGWLNEAFRSAAYGNSDPEMNPGEPPISGRLAGLASRLARGEA